MDNNNNNVEVDDSYILRDDKIKLLGYIKTIYLNKYGWADDILSKCLILEHYNSIIKNINKADYLKEKELENTKDLLDCL